MTKAEKALELFANNFNCSQAVLTAFAPDLGLDEKLALMLGTQFGGGARNGEMCGAVSGALMVLGLKYGHCIKGDTESKQRADLVNDRFLEEFAKRNGSYICNDLLGCDVRTMEGVNYALENRLFTEFCPKMVKSAVEIVEDITKEMEK